MNLVEVLRPELENLVHETKNSVNEIKRVAIAQAWKILQLAIARTITLIENNAKDLAGKDKKAAAMQLLSTFYDSVFVVVDLPLVPSIVEPIIHKYIKSFLMILVGSTIDAMVTTFREVGVFAPKTVADPDPNEDTLKVSNK
jgi:hypothetical protein